MGRQEKPLERVEVNLGQSMRMCQISVKCRSGYASVETHGTYSARESTTCVPNEVEREPSPNPCSSETKRVRRQGTPSAVGENCDHPDNPMLFTRKSELV